MSEEGDDEERDKYLTMKDDWMYDELGIGGSNFEAVSSTLNPDAPEFEPREHGTKRSKWEANGYDIYEKYVD